jgi:hypothetical protein
MEDRPEIRPRPDLLESADLKAVDTMVARLIAQEREVSATDLMGAVAVAAVEMTVFLVRRHGHALEDAAGRALSVTELVVEGWAKDFRRRHGH